MSNFAESDVRRQKSGQPTGGQFAEKERAASGIALSASAEPADAHGGYRMRRVETSDGGAGFSATLTRNGKDVAEMRQRAGGVVIARFYDGQHSEEARRFAEAGAAITGESDPEAVAEEMATRLVTAASMNRKRGVIARLNTDPDFWETGSFRQIKSARTREDVLADLRTRHFAADVEVWDKERAAFVPLDEAH